MKSSRLLLLPAALLVLAGCKRHDPNVTAATLPVVQVEAAAVQAAQTPVFTTFTGTVRSVQRAVLSAKVMGTVAEVPVILGQPVAAGELLLRLSAAEIEARVAQAKAQLNQVTRDLERERALLAREASTADMVRTLEDRQALTAAMVREAETMLGYTLVRAPFAGTIARKHVDSGDLASPGQPLLELTGNDAFEIETNLPASLATRLTKGTDLNVEVPDAGAPFTATVTEISSAADPRARTVPVRLAIPAGATVHPGQFARVQVPGEAAASLTVPATAVTRFGQMERVFVISADHLAGLRLVKTGAVSGDNVEILSGLNAGERVVTAPPAGLRDGQPLEILP
jgi:RND family efflux transporter MFP subunit